MNKFFWRMLALATIAALTACSGGAGNAIPGSGAGAPMLATNVALSCATPDLSAGDEARCFAQFRTDAGGGDPNGFHGTYVDGAAPESTDVRNGTPAGYGPSDLQSAYNLPSATAGSGQTVAIVDAYNDPNAEADLGVYRAQFGLSACTTANGCFKKVNQSGQQSRYPRNNGGWAQEISLDLDMASAICPKCHILLVEANSASFSNLGTAVNTAANLGANTISNSYGGGEFSSSNSNYNHPGHVITASAGDSGTGAQQPASYGTVVAVGGTSLTRGGSRGWSETTWSGTGSGCSALVSKPSFQTDSGCTKRSEADTSAVADPNTGVAVYDSYSYGGAKGWLVFGGTSVSSPIIAGVYALAGNAGSQNYAQSIWQHGGTSAFFDVTTGSNGSCSIHYICNAGPGYDGPTGWGTPNGTTAF